MCVNQSRIRRLLRVHIDRRRKMSAISVYTH
jgi:hypothetical protein